MDRMIRIRSLDIPELDVYAGHSEPELRHLYEPDGGVFIVESPLVIGRALDAGYEPISLLVQEDKSDAATQETIRRVAGWRNSDREENDGSPVPVYAAPMELLTGLTGFQLTRGAICAMRRRAQTAPEEILKTAHRIAVLEDVVNPTNVGAIIRSAAALGMDAVLLTPACSDPLYRRAARVSMGTVFQIPWTYLPEGAGPEYLRRLGFSSAAMALRNDTMAIGDSRLAEIDRLAVYLGTEGEGLREETIDACDVTVKIPMYHGVDSLNVAAASAVAFFALSRKEE